MTSTIIYHYVYRITNLVENKHYYGKRSSKIEPKLDLGHRYFSSSVDKDFIEDQKENPTHYKYKIIANFDTSKEALAFEIKLHNKFNVGRNISFYNKAKQRFGGFDTAGRIAVQDLNGNIFSVSIDDPKFLNGEYKHHLSGKTYEEIYGDRANEQRLKRGFSIKKSKHHTSGISKGAGNPNAKKWILVSPDNEIIDLKEITLSEYSKKNNLSASDLCSVSTDTLRHSGGWLCFKKELFNDEELNKKIRERDITMNLSINKRKMVSLNGSIKVFEKVKEILDYYKMSRSVYINILKSGGVYNPSRKINNYKHLLGLKIEFI